MDQAVLEVSSSGDMIRAKGAWSVQQVADLEHRYEHLKKDLKSVRKIDIKLSQLDSAGALLLEKIIYQISSANPKVAVKGLTNKQLNLISFVSEQSQEIFKAIKPKKVENFFYQVGVWGYDKYLQAFYFLNFFGEVMMAVFGILAHPSRLKWRSTVAAIDDTGYQALPIVALMSFLIGIVLAYQLAQQLKIYGADIFIVDVTGIAILREFGPLITAVIVAGRTSTSFAALLGTMKVNEEIDAIRTMGISPIQRLVLPRIVGLMVALPLLVVWADIFGVLGSMVMAKNMLAINFNAFIERFEIAVQLKEYILGLIKAPVFALIIAAVGCFQGFQVKNNAESVGVQTTKAAVQAIFLIIIADAVFSVIFSELGY